MNLKAFILLLLGLGSTALAEDSLRPPDRMRIRAALMALAKADSIKVTGQATYKDSEGGMITKPISKEIKSRETIAKLSSLLTSKQWDIVFQHNYTVNEWRSTFVRMISYEKGRKADEFKLVGRNHLSHPWMGIFCNNSESLNMKAFQMILDAE